MTLIERIIWFAIVISTCVYDQFAPSLPVVAGLYLIYCVLVAIQHQIPKE